MDISKCTEWLPPMAKRQYWGKTQVFPSMAARRSSGKAVQINSAWIGGAEHQAQNHCGVRTLVNAFPSSNALTSRESSGIHTLERALPPCKPWSARPLESAQM